jgi:hypothetical protein
LVPNKIEELIAAGNLGTSSKPTGRSDTGVSGSDARTLFAILRKLRVAKEDFTS